MDFWPHPQGGCATNFKLTYYRFPTLWPLTIHAVHVFYLRNSKIRFAFHLNRTTAMQSQTTDNQQTNLTREQKVNPLTVNLPSRLPRSAFRGEATTGDEIDRLLRALGRLHMWQCPCCNEIFPQSTASVFGACAECFISNEDVHEKIDLENLPLHDIARAWLAWSRVIHSFMPHNLNALIRLPNSTPCELHQLEVLWSIVGEVKMMQAIHTTACRSFHYPDKLRFVVGQGIIPRSLDAGLPRSRVEWQKDITACATSVE